MPLDYIDPTIGLPIAFGLWAILMVIVFRDSVVLRINNFFANRRHIRRKRNRQQAAKDYKALG